MNQQMHDFSESRRDQPSLADDLRNLVQAFTSRWRLIAAIMSVFLFLGVAHMWLATPVYTSSTEIFIDPRERNLVENAAVPTGMGSSSQGADISLLESQISILGSRVVLGTLIERENLENDPEFSSSASGPVAAVKQTLRALLYGPNAIAFSQPISFDKALIALQKKVSIERVDQTYVLSVSVETQSPEKSARLANALADIYLADGQNATDESARETVDSIEARLSELRANSEASQQAVQNYRKANGLVDAQGASVNERRLTELSAQAVDASVEAEFARAAVENLKQDGANAADSATIQDLRVLLDQAVSDEKALEGTLGVRHPRLVEAKETRLSLQQALNDELERVIARAQRDYENALQKESALNALLEKSTDALTQSNTASVKLHELEQVAEQDRALYDSFATKAKQMREQISLPTTTARIISVAEPSAYPSEPRTIIVLAVCLFLGAVAGFGTAWILHVFSTSLSVQRGRLKLVSRATHRAAAE